MVCEHYQPKLALPARIIGARDDDIITIWLECLVQIHPISAVGKLGLGGEVIVIDFGQFQRGGCCCHFDIDESVTRVG